MSRGPKKGLKRSGLAITQYCQGIKWKPKTIFLAGVGLQHKEVDLMYDQWPDVPLYGWEPHPSTYESIVETFPGILYPYGLSEKPGMRRIRNRVRHKNGASLYARFDKSDTEFYTVETRTLDQHLDLLPTQESSDSLLWLDCEGAELEILRGGQEFVRAGIGVINVEMTGRPQHIGWATPKEVHAFLTEAGFTTVWIHSIRVPVSQYDAIYLRNHLVDETFKVW